MKNPREIVLSIGKYPRFCLSFIKFEIHIVGHRIPKVSNHNVLLMVVIMSSQ